MEYKEFSKLSIHNHIGGQESERKLNEAYNKNVNFNMLEAVNLINDAAYNNFNVIAITNANIFKVSHYLMAKIYANQKNIELLPGVELNIADNKCKKFLHLVVLVDPNSDLIGFEQAINNAIIKNGENYINISQLVEIIIKYKTILIPHGLKQSNEKKKNKDRSSAGNVEQFKEIISIDDAIPVLIEDSKSYHKKTLELKLNNFLDAKEKYWVSKSVSVSAADRKSFSEIESPTYIWGGKTFEDLYFATLMKSTRIKREEDIITKTSYISRIEIIPKVDNPQINKSIIKCSHGLNSIIGKSGSGKTLLLNAIKLNIANENLTSRTSGISAYDNIYKDVEFKIYDSNNNCITNSSGWKIFEGENLYTKILQVYSSDKSKLVGELKLKINDEQFKRVINNFSKRVNEYCKTSIKINELRKILDKNMASFYSNILFLKENDRISGNSIMYLVDSKLQNESIKLIDEIKEKLSDLKKYNYNASNIREIIKKYASSEVEQRFDEVDKEIIFFIKDKIKKLSIKEIEYKEKLLLQTKLYNIVKNYNSILGKKIEAIMRKNQENLKLLEQIKNNLMDIVLLNEKLCVPVIDIKNLNNVLFLENNKISKLVIKKIKTKFDRSQFTTIFDSCIGGHARNKLNLSDFKMDEVDLSNSASIVQFLNVFIAKEFSFDILINNDFNNYFEYELQLKNSNNDFVDIETMSAGELSKTYINNLLDMQIDSGGSNLVILFDQPDNNLEKKFILNELVSKINDLRIHYQVFITTHEPLLVVNADSNNIIEARNDKSAVSAKNKISYKNLSFVKNANTKEEMVSIIAELVDGSYEAIKERKKIYGGMLNENSN